MAKGKDPGPQKPETNRRGRPKGRRVPPEPPEMLLEPVNLPLEALELQTLLSLHWHPREVMLEFHLERLRQILRKVSHKARVARLKDPL